MASNDEDSEFELSDEDIEDTSPYTLRRRPVEDALEVGGGNSARKRARSDVAAADRTAAAEPRQLRLPTDRRVVSDRLRRIKRTLQGAEYDMYSSLRIAHAALKLQDDYLVLKRKNGSRPTPAPRIRQQMCSLFSISSHTYASIMRNALVDGRAYTSRGRGNYNDKMTRIPRSTRVIAMVRDFVCTERSQRRRVTGRQVMEMLVTEGVLQIPRDGEGIYDKKAYQSAYRNTRRWLEKNGYQRGKRSGSIRPKEHVVL